MCLTVVLIYAVNSVLQQKTAAVDTVGLPGGKVPKTCVCVSVCVHKDVRVYEPVCGLACSTHISPSYLLW